MATAVPSPRPRAATYRVQLHAGFTFDDAAAHRAATWPTSASATCTARRTCRRRRAAPTATTWSTTARSTTSSAAPTGYASAGRRLGRAGLGQVLDIVPNHMAIAGRANAWWWDVLENGPASRYASYFDIDWDPPRAQAGRHACWCRCWATSTAGCSRRASWSSQRQGGSFAVRYLRPRAAGVAADPRRAAGRPAADAAGSAELASLADRLRPPAARQPHRPGRGGRAAPGQGGAARPAGRPGARTSPRSRPPIDAEVDGAERRPRRARRRCSASRTSGWPTGGRRRGARLPALLRHRDAGRAAGRGPGGVRRHPRADRSSWSRDGTSTGCGSTTSTGSRDPERLPRPAARRHRRRARRGREDPASPTRSCPALAGRRHDRLRLPEPGQRAVRRPGGARRPLRGRLRAASPGGRPDYDEVVHEAKLADHARGAARRGGAAHRPAGRRVRAAPAPPRPHPPRAARGAARDASPRSPSTAPTSGPGSRSTRRRPGARGARPSARRRQRRPDLDAELLAFLGELLAARAPGRRRDRRSPCASSRSARR